MGSRMRHVVGIFVPTTHARYSLPSLRCRNCAESDERALLSQHRIETIVAKNSGGTATYGKIAAARALDTRRSRRISTIENRNASSALCGGTPCGLQAISV